MKLLILFAAFFCCLAKPITLEQAVKIVEKEPVTEYFPLQIHDVTGMATCSGPCVEIQVDASNPKCKGNTILVLKHNGNYSLLKEEYSFKGIFVYHICNYPTGLFEYYFFNQNCYKDELCLGSFEVKRNTYDRP